MKLISGSSLPLSYTQTLNSDIHIQNVFFFFLLLCETSFYCEIRFIRIIIIISFHGPLRLVDYLIFLKIFSLFWLLVSNVFTSLFWWGYIPREFKANNIWWISINFSDFFLFFIDELWNKNHACRSVFGNYFYGENWLI